MKLLHRIKFYFQTFASCIFLLFVFLQPVKAQELKKQKEQIKLSHTEVTKLNYIKADEAHKYLSNAYLKYIKPHPEQNALIITASSELIHRIKEDLKKIDILSPQIMIESLITEFSEDVSKKLAFEWNLTKGIMDINLPTEGFTFTYLGNLPQNFYGILQTLVDEGKAKIRTNPKIVTLNGHEAEIVISKVLYYYTTSDPASYSGVVTRLESVESPISLKITPWTSGAEYINIDIISEVGNVVNIGSEGLPEITKRTAKTRVRVKDGETIVIGGLTQQEEQKLITKVPILGDIPLLKYLFRNTQKTIRNSELNIFITPRILKTDQKK